MNKEVIPSFLESTNDRVPRAEHLFRHALDIQTRFTDIDIFGHVNNNSYLAMMDLAKVDYFKTITDGRESLADIRAVVVHVECDFFEPSYFDEPLQVWTSITSVGVHSFTLEQRVVNTITLSTKCIGRTVLAGFDPKAKQGIEIDSHLRDVASHFEQRPL